MLFSRFDRQRLQALTLPDVQARSCARTEALLAACRLGAGPATRPWAQPFGQRQIEWPLGLFHVPDAEVARRACLLLDGSWALADLPSSAARWRLRLAALAADAAWWRPLALADAWDAGLAPSIAALRGFTPRRATLIVVPSESIDQASAQALDELEQRSRTWSRALRLALVGASVPAFVRAVAV